MTKRPGVAITLAAAILGVAWLILAQTGLGARLPPRTATKLARTVSGLTVPRNAQVLKFTDEWNVFGDGFAEVELALTADAVERLKQEAVDRGYRAAASGRQIAFDSGSPLGPDGLYLLRGELTSGNYELSVLDVARRRLSVRVVAP